MKLYRKDFLPRKFGDFAKDSRNCISGAGCIVCFFNGRPMKLYMSIFGKNENNSNGIELDINTATGVIIFDNKLLQVGSNVIFHSTQGIYHSKKRYSPSELFTISIERTSNNDIYVRVYKRMNKQKTINNTKTVIIEQGNINNLHVIDVDNSAQKLGFCYVNRSHDEYYGYYRWSDPSWFFFGLLKKHNSMNEIGIYNYSIDYINADNKEQRKKRHIPDEYLVYKIAINNQKLVIFNKDNLHVTDNIIGIDREQRCYNTGIRRYVRINIKTGATENIIYIQILRDNKILYSYKLINSAGRIVVLDAPNNELIIDKKFTDIIENKEEKKVERTKEKGNNMVTLNIKNTNTTKCFSLNMSPFNMFSSKCGLPRERSRSKEVIERDNYTSSIGKLFFNTSVKKPTM